MHKLFWLSLDPQSPISLGLVSQELMKRLDNKEYKKTAVSYQMLPLTPRNLGYCEAYQFGNWERAVEYYLDRFQPDTVFIYGPLDIVGSYCRFVDESYDEKYKLMFYYTFETSPPPLGAKDWLSRMDEILVPSKWCKREFEKTYGIKAFVLPHGVDMNIFKPNTKPHNEKPFVYGYVGRLYGRKQINRLLPAVYKIKNEVDWKFRLDLHAPGTTQEVAQTNQMFKRYGIEDVVAWNPVMYANVPIPTSVMPSYYWDMHVLVLPTGGEAWGLPYTEAMATGTPVITTDLEVSREVMGDVGIYANVEAVHPSFLGDMPLVDIDDIKDKMIRLHDDEDLYYFKAGWGINRAKEIRWEYVIEMLKRRIHDR